MYVINVKTGIYYLCPWTFAFPFWWCCRRKPGPCAHQANALVTYPLAPQIEAFCGHCSTALRSMTYMFLSTLPQSMSGAEQPLSLHHCFRGVQPAAGDANCSVKRLPLGCPASRRSRRLSSVSPANWNDWQGQSVKSCLCLLGLFGCIQTHFFFVTRWNVSSCVAVSVLKLITYTCDPNCTSFHLCSMNVPMYVTAVTKDTPALFIKVSWS